ITPPADLVPMPMVIATLALSMVGVLGNGMVILATIMSRSLRNRCNVLICILAISDFFICIYLVQLRILMLQKWYLRPNIDCYIYSIYGLFTLNVQAGMGLVLGVDRLLAVSLPIRYSRLPKKIYVSLMVVILLFAAFMTLYGYVDATDQPVPVCLPPTAYNGRSRFVWVGSNFVISLMVISVYGAAHAKCRKLNAVSNHQQSIDRIRRLLNSLSIVMGVYISCWFVTIVGLIVTLLCPLPTEVVKEINQQLGWLVIINASTNFFIYLWRAPEYRRAFLNVLQLGRVQSSTVSELPSNKSQIAATRRSTIFKPSVP
uniref:G_PROTEIN_RECEP_F1_2 domain-containing protein n=1 Tax=Haemonchus contortus TaxID=6289 RepID=A0A7I4YS14_HAECO